MRRVLPLTWLMLLAPAGVRAQEPPAELLVRARTLLEQAPLIDTHNDLPSMLLEERGGDLTGLDLGAVQAGLSADAMRQMERVAAELQQSEPPLAAELPAGEAP